MLQMDVSINNDHLAIMMYSLPPSFEKFKIAIASHDKLPALEILRIKIIEEYEARKNTAFLSTDQGALYVERKYANKKKGNAHSSREDKSKKPFNY